MISDALVKLADRNGSSRQAIVKFIAKNYKLEEKFVNQHAKIVLKNNVKSGNLKQAKGVGASGSFKLGDKLKLKAKKSQNALKKAAVKSSPAPSVLAKKVVKVTITKATKTASAKKSGDTKPKRNLAKVVKVRQVSKPVTKAAAASRIKQAVKRTPIQAKKSSNKPVINKTAAKKVVNKKTKRA